MPVEAVGASGYPDAQSAPFLTYPPIEQHGLIGDRRTAALVAADGTIDWLCLPDYDGTLVLGALLDSERGGFWRLGPAVPVAGRQRYLDDTAVLVTTWDLADAELEVRDAFAWPGDDRAPGREHQRTLLRRLHCRRGTAEARLAFHPRYDFDPVPGLEVADAGLSIGAGEVTIGFWANCPLSLDAAGARTTFRLAAGEEIWSVLALGGSPSEWLVARANVALQETTRYWRDWSHGLTYTGPRGKQVRRCAQTVHLLSYAPAGSLVAAPTTPSRLRCYWPSRLMHP